MTLARLPPKCVDYEPGTDPFFNQLPLVQEKDPGWLEFSGASVPLTKLNSLYIRSSYRVIADQVLGDASPQCVTVTGTPGTGTSVFLYYLMWRLVNLKRRVLLLTFKPPMYFDGERMLSVNLLPLSHDREFWSSDLWCSVHVVDPTWMPGIWMHDSHVVFVTLP